MGPWLARWPCLLNIWVNSIVDLPLLRNSDEQNEWICVFFNEIPGKLWL